MDRYINYNRRTLRTLKDKTVNDMKENIKRFSIINLLLNKKDKEDVKEFLKMLDILFEYKIGDLLFLEFNNHYKEILIQAICEFLYEDIQELKK